MNLWDKQDYETNLDYECFSSFLTMAKPRSLEDCYPLYRQSKFGDSRAKAKNKQIPSRWRKMFDGLYVRNGAEEQYYSWHERAAAYDYYLENSANVLKKKDLIIEKEQEDLERLLSVWNKSVDIFQNELEKVSDEKPKMSTIITQTKNLTSIRKELAELIRRANRIPTKYTDKEEIAPVVIQYEDSTDAIYGSENIDNYDEEDIGVGYDELMEDTNGNNADRGNKNKVAETSQGGTKGDTSAST